MIRLGMVGCGNMWRSFAQRLGPVRARLQVTACVDVDLPRAQAAALAVAQATGAAQPVAAQDFCQILDRVDALLLALPHHEHHPVALACLNAGKHVLLEKPMANSEEQCLDLIQAADAQQRVLMIAYVMRYHPLVVKLKELLDSGKFGPCFHMSIWTEQFTRPPDGHWIRNAQLLGGGQFFSHGCHYVDLLLWFLGAPKQGSHIGTNLGTPWMEKEGSSDVAIKFESGAVGYHMGTWGARGTKLGYAIHAHCTNGMLELDFRRGIILLHQFKLGRDMIEPHIDSLATEDEFGTHNVLFQTDTGKQTDKELLHFLDCIENRRIPDTDGRAALQSLRVIWRMYEAEERGTMADLRGLGLPTAARG